MQGPPSPLQFDTALALEDQTIRAIAEAPMDILTGEDPDQVDLDTSGHELSERDVDAIMDDQVSLNLNGENHSGLLRDSSERTRFNLSQRDGMIMK